MPSRYLEIHPKDPQPRLIRQAVALIREGGIVVYPTDSCYALGCHIGDKEAMERISRIRQTDKHHHFTLVCRDLSEISHYARVNNQQYRTLKAFTPGPYTFILAATRQTPKRLQNPRRRTIGIREGAAAPQPQAESSKVARADEPQVDHRPLDARQHRTIGALHEDAARRPLQRHAVGERDVTHAGNRTDCRRDLAHERCHLRGVREPVFGHR